MINKKIMTYKNQHNNKMYKSLFEQLEVKKAIT